MTTLETIETTYCVEHASPVAYHRPDAGECEYSELVDGADEPCNLYRATIVVDDRRP